LQEISANIPAKKQSPIKKKLFRAFDGHSSILDDTLPFEQEDLDEPEVVTGGNENESAVSIVDSRLGGRVSLRRKVHTEKGHLKIRAQMLRSLAINVFYSF